MQKHQPLFYSLLALVGIGGLSIVASIVFGFTARSDILALIQVIIGVVLVPSAIYGYLSAKASLDAALMPHNLVVEWEVLKIVGSSTESTRPTNTHPYRLTPILINKGTGI